MKGYKSSAICWFTVGMGIVLFFVGCQQTRRITAPESTPSKMSFDRRLNEALSAIESQNLNVILAFSHNDGPIQLLEYGTPAGDGISPELTQVDINSVTKTVTGVMAAKLVEQGRARLDETLEDFFENVPADKSEISLHQLLTHSAGFQSAIGNDYEPIGKSEFLERAFKSELESSPGKEYSYSNVGFGIVAAIIEARSGKSYEAYLLEDLLKGLELSDTGYGSIYDDARSLRTNDGRTIKEASWGNLTPHWHLIGNGGLVSTAQDMIRFRQAVVSGNIISKEMLEIVQTPHVREYADDTSYYGYGLVVQDVTDKARFYWHDGGNGMFSAQWGDYPEQNITLFTVGVDEDAYKAMRSFEKHLNVFGKNGG